jgi:hypothetical protein
LAAENDAKAEKQGNNQEENRREERERPISHSDPLSLAAQTRKRNEESGMSNDECGKVIPRMC